MQSRKKIKKPTLYTDMINIANYIQEKEGIKLINEDTTDFLKALYLYEIKKRLPILIKKLDNRHRYEKKKSHQFIEEIPDEITDLVV